jgi:F-type H+-transporting ATPase subunit b
MTQRLIAFALLAVALVPGSALAESGHGEGHGSPWTLIWQGVNVVILVGVLLHFGGPSIKAFFAGRRQDIATQIDRAAALLAEAEARVAEWNGRMARLDSEIAEIGRTTRERAEIERQRIVADATRSAERIRRDAGIAIEQETARARDQLRADATRLAVELAADLLRQHVTDADRNRLVDEFIQQIASPPAASPRS